MDTKKKDFRAPTMGESVFVITAMLVILIGGCLLGLRYELLMVLVAIVAALVAIIRCKLTWAELEESICLKMKSVVPTLIMIFSTGALIASLIYSGSVPTLIYWGLALIKPQYIYISAFLLCAVMSVATGSSWSAAGTAGVAAFGMAVGLNASLPVVVGAIITGSIFGDKLSPLSETTNMAPACAGTDLYSHIKSMMFTTVPASLIGCVVWLVAGFRLGGASEDTAESVVMLRDELSQLFGMNVLVFIPFVIILYAAIAKRPPIPCMIFAILSALLIGWLYQGFDLAVGFADALNGFQIAGVNESFTPSDDLIKLLERGGAKSMSGVVIMCFSGFSCAAIVAKAGFLEKILSGMNSKLNSRTKAMTAAMATNLFIMIATGTAYIAFILVSEMYKKIFIENGMNNQVLSRSLEDIGTCVGCLIPWSLSGAYYAGLFSIPIWGAGGYALWTVLPYITPFIAIFLAATGIGCYKLSEEEKAEKLKALDEIVA